LFARRDAEIAHKGIVPSRTKATESGDSIEVPFPVREGAIFKAPLRVGEGFGERSADLCVHRSLAKGREQDYWIQTDAENLTPVEFQFKGDGRFLSNVN
jgi:hypothetical protein